MSIDRRTVLKAGAWSVPVIAVAIATPLASASVAPKTPVKCERTDSKNPWWNVYYSDGSVEVLHNGDVMSDKTLQALCTGRGPKS